VSTKHANFIQADDGGSADDVFALVREVQRVVTERTGIHLQPELRVVGFPA
jgi:UDP-N-acetylmuramate dehydrogenase